jgi:hypothetical protein
MPEFDSDLSSEDDRSNLGDDGNNLEDDTRNWGDDGSNLGDDESDADTNSYVSDYDNVAYNEIVDPTWHITSPKSPSPSPNASVITEFLQGRIDVPSKSIKQWLRYLMWGCRMKTIDQNLLDVAEHIKWEIWLFADEEYSAYTECIRVLMRIMDASKMFL